MNDLDFAGFLVSRVCHDLVGPMGAVVNGLEVLEDETDAAMRADALRIVTQSAGQALARLQFLRIAFGAAGSAGAELDLSEVGRLVNGLLEGGKVRLDWQAAHVHWPKDWAKLLMNAALVAADALPRGGDVIVKTAQAGSAPSFLVRASGAGAKIFAEAEKAVRGETENAGLDARGIQPFLAYRLAERVGTSLSVSASEGAVEVKAG